MNIFKKNEDIDTGAEKNITELRKNAIESALQKADIKYQFKTINDEISFFEMGFDAGQLPNIRIHILLFNDGRADLRTGSIAKVQENARMAVLSELNEANCKYRAGKYYIDKEGDIILQQYISGGISPEELAKEVVLLIIMSV